MKNLQKPLLLLFAAIAVSNLEAQTAPGTRGINLNYMDTSVKPGDDFFKFVNGKWVEKTEIPADRTRWGSFDELRQNTDRDALAILMAASNNKEYSAGTDQGKAVGLFQSILDTVSRNKNGVKPLKPFLAKIDAIKNIKELQNLLVEMEPFGGIGVISVNVGSDARNSNVNIASINPGSVGLPDRDYYVSDDKDSKEKREKYVSHLTRMLQYLGEKPATAASNAKKILALEIEMSLPRLDRVERRDRRKTNNPMHVSDLQKLTPKMNWDSFLTQIKMGEVDTLNVSQPKYMKALNEMLTEQKLSDWKAYLRWTLLNKYSGMLSTEIEDANWEFYGKTLTGAVKQRPRDERALQTINGSVGEALGKLYVAEKFPPEAKQKAEKMIQYLFKAYDKRIRQLDWMDAETKTMALAKLNKINVKIGYPDKWRDYSALEIKSPTDGGTFFENSQALSKWRYEENLKDLKRPVDKKRWGMSPQTVNAYYNAANNEIVFPAAILQPPFYDYKADEAVNYGGIGGVIGHEISHGFDDSGSRYNADGNLVNWWSEKDLDAFTKHGTSLAAQYSAIEALPGAFVDGKFTLGENIGDLGGINAAYDALQMYLAENGNPGKIDGFTPEQRFFISWGTIWRTKMRDEAIRNQLKTDPHSPGMYRAYVPLQNVDAFYEAFNIDASNKLYLASDKRIRMW